MTEIDENIIELLDIETARINTPDFVEADPVQFPRHFDKLQDIEITAFLSATIAWGNRKMICSNCEKMLRLMDYQPYNYVCDEGYEELPGRFNIHRTFFSDDFAYFLRGLHRIYSRHGSLDAFASACKVGECEMPAWELVHHMAAEFETANNGESSVRCLPGNLDKTALKRINMALRWLVRNDGIVDLGVWKSLRPSQLFIPLDVHVGNTARALGLLSRKANDRLAVEQLTATLRTLRPDDPVAYDFALFGLGIGGKYTNTNIQII